MSYRKLSSHSGNYVQRWTSWKCSDIKSQISRIEGRDKCSLEIVSLHDGLFFEDDVDLPLQCRGLIDVMIHPLQRRVPRHALSELPDMIDCSMDEPRVSMSCQHAITPDNLYQMASVYLKEGKCDIGCVQCGTLWDFGEIKEKADMSADEAIFWGCKLSLNFMRRGDSSDITECPACGAFCERISKHDKGAVCQQCSKKGDKSVTFCWECKDMNWSESHVCLNQRRIQELLDTCPRKTIDYANIENVPSVRVCPKCGTLIEHHAECKEMDCPKCLCKFCFVCLKLCVDGRLVCNNYNAKCDVAPVQNVL